MNGTATLPPGFDGRPAPAPLPVLATATGITIQPKSVQIRTDWASVKSLIESGVPFKEVAEHFKIREDTIRSRSAEEKWLTPSKVEKLRKEIQAKQADTFKRTGKAASVDEVKAEIWAERGERWKERIAGIADAALEGLAEDPERAGALIADMGDLEKMVKVTRVLTGEEKAENDAPKVAVNIGFLRSQGGPVDIVDVEEV